MGFNPDTEEERLTALQVGLNCTNVLVVCGQEGRFQVEVPYFSLVKRGEDGWTFSLQEIFKFQAGKRYRIVVEEVPEPKIKRR